MPGRHGGLLREERAMNEPVALRSLLRQTPFLTHQDSVYRAVEMLRHGGSDTLPVLDARGLLVGALALADLRPLLDGAGGADVAVGSAAVWARKPSAVGSTEINAEQAREALAASGETTLFIVDGAGRYVGGVSLADLLVPGQVRVRPTTAGGMATPWGVHLHTGAVQAGSGLLELVASGAVLGVLIVTAFTLVGVVTWAIQMTTRWAVFDLWLEDAPAHLTFADAGWFLLHAASAPLFLVLMRLLPLTGYHAAEHQAVHALERGEPLHVEVVRRMPRIHPRCGTNLMAGGLVFVTVSQLVASVKVLGLEATDGAVLGGLAALFTWRSVGAFLQQYFTTKPATDKQLAAGIAAASELERKYAQQMPVRLALWRRIWHMGLLPTFVGATAGSSAAAYIAYWILTALAARVPH
jgi:hypothetical protein